MVGSNTPEDFFMEHLLVGMAEFYLRNLSREIMTGLKQRALQGHLVLARPSATERKSSTGKKGRSEPESSAGRSSMKGGAHRAAHVRAL